jgi:peptide/nickel transport system permease protein
MRGEARRLLDDRRARAGAALLALAVLAALLAPLLAGDPIAQHDIVATRFLPPLARDLQGSLHLLGTDRFGRDVWARLVYGARVSLGVGALATVLSVAIGMAVGAAAGYWRGWVGVTLLGVTDFALALPRVVLLLLLASLWQPSAGLTIVVLGLTGWMTIARLVHAEVRALSARPFVESATGLGARDLRILLRHILPNALTPVIVAAALGLGNAILLEAGLSFLGLGVQPPTPSWGVMLADAQSYLAQAPRLALYPGLAILLCSLSFNLLGDGLRDALDPRTQR